jgi:hypothetical protein
MEDRHVSYNETATNGLHGLDCTKIACWAHARRGFLTLLKTNPKSKGKSVLSHIFELYGIESDLRKQFK